MAASMASVSFRRLAGGSRTLSFCVDYALTNHRTPENEKALDEAKQFLSIRPKRADKAAPATVPATPTPPVLAFFAAA